MVLMKYQVLFGLIKQGRDFKCCMLQIVWGALRINYMYTRYIDAKELIGSKLLFLSPIRSRKGAYQVKTSLAIDSDIKR